MKRNSNSKDLKDTHPQVKQILVQEMLNECAGETAMKRRLIKPQI